MNPAIRRWGGAGDVLEPPVRALSGVALGVGDTVATLAAVDVLTRSIAAGAAEDYLDCNVGHDVLDQFAGYAINFRDMAFVLR